MSDLPATHPTQANDDSPFADAFEQSIFAVSPVGTFATSVAIFLVLMVLFEITALIARYPLADQLRLSPQEGGWQAIILSLITAVALGMQRYVRLKDSEDDSVLSRLLTGGSATFGASQAAARGKLLWIGMSGAALGLVIAFMAVPVTVRTQHLPVFLWFGMTMSLLGALFARGAVMTRRGARDFADLVDRHLKVDLLRVDELNVIGRSSARVSLIWLSVAAVVCLFFAGGQTPLLVIAIIIFSAGMALWIFFRSLERVHNKIRQAKRAELDRVRHEIAQMRSQAAHDHTAASRLHGLLAYETRIAAVHEWPFDQSTLLRVGVYVLIPAAPATGQALMRYFVEHFSL